MVTTETMSGCAKLDLLSVCELQNIACLCNKTRFVCEYVHQCLLVTQLRKLGTDFVEMWCVASVWIWINWTLDQVSYINLYITHTFSHVVNDLNFLNLTADYCFDQRLKCTSWFHRSFSQDRNKEAELF